MQRVKCGVQRMECRMTGYVPDVENGTVYIRCEEWQGDIGLEDGKVLYIGSGDLHCALAVGNGTVSVA